MASASFRARRGLGARRALSRAVGLAAWHDWDATSGHGYKNYRRGGRKYNRRQAPGKESVRLGQHVLSEQAADQVEAEHDDVDHQANGQAQVVEAEQADHGVIAVDQRGKRRADGEVERDDREQAA